MASTDEWLLRRQIRQHLQLLKFELKSFQSLESSDDGKSLSNEDLHRKSVVCALIQEFNYFLGFCTNADAKIDNTDHAAVCSESVKSCNNGGREKGRYLCVSFGFAIFCLDLKRNKGKCCYDDDELPSLPIIFAVDLLKEEIPVSMGFLKVNSDLYMVGGQEFHGFNRSPATYWDLSLFDFLYRRYGLQGTSPDSFHLSLTDDNRLSFNECNYIGPLNKPKAWPIIEKIGDKIHVIESMPEPFITYEPEDTIPSHEVLDLKHVSRGWKELPPVCFPKDDESGMYIWNHIVVGDRIYASPTTYPGRHFAVFDSKTSKWELHETKARELEWKRFSGYRPFSINHVSQVLRFGYGRCVAKSLHGDVYVLMALIRCNDDMSMRAEAYLVTPRGQILCFQKLPHFFKEFNRPFHASEGRLIKVDDEHGETMCAILQGILGKTSDGFLLISTFTVDEAANADMVVHDLLSQAFDEEDVTKLPCAVERDFVKVAMKDMHIYKKDYPEPDEEYFEDSLTGVSACFL